MGRHAKRAEDLAGERHYLACLRGADGLALHGGVDDQRDLLRLVEDRGRTSQAGEAVWLGPCPWAARRWARRRRRGSHRSHIVPLGRVPPPATPWRGPVAEAREEGRRATRWTCHDLESRTTERQARHTNMQARPATESYWVLTSYHVPITSLYSAPQVLLPAP